MGNSIFINYSMKAFYSTSKTVSSTNSAASPSTGLPFLDMFQALQGQGNAVNAAASGAADTATMTMGEYKEYITGKFNALPMHSSRTYSVSCVVISTSGWERMKNDLSFEEWVINKVAEDLASQDPWESVGSSSYTVYRFGDSMDSYSCDNWGKDYPGDIKSYLASELLDTSNSTGSGNLLFRLARKKMQQQNEAAIQQLASDISRLQSLNLMRMDQSPANALGNSVLGANNGFQLASAQNALSLLSALNDNFV